MVDPDQVRKRILDAYTSWADAQDKANRAEAAAKRTFSALVIAYVEEAGSISKAEHMARSSAKYERDQIAAEQAQHAANLAKGWLEAAKVWWEAVRTTEATARAEANIR